MEPNPIILAYIDLNLQTLAAARMLTPFGPVGQTHWGDSANNSPSPATHSADAQLKQELAVIFKKIGDKQTRTIGLYELYRIAQLYPKMAKNTAAGKTPKCSNVNSSSSSAECFSETPVDVNSLNEAKSQNMRFESVNLNMPFHRDDRAGNTILRSTSYDNPELKHHTVDERHERYQSGVTGGTLDAIRERLKSVQLAAAGGYPYSGNNPLMYVNDNLSHGQISNTTLHNESCESSRLQRKL